MDNRGMGLKAQRGGAQGTELKGWMDRGLQMGMALPKGSFPLHHPIIQPA